MHDERFEEYIVEAIRTIVESYVSDLGYDITIEGEIIAVNGDGTYEVKVGDATNTTTLKAREGLSLIAGDMCDIKIKRNSKGKRFIDCKRVV